jgi:hypothetical protein
MTDTKVTLTDEERETLEATGMAMGVRQSAAVESIVAHRVAEALRDAADEMEKQKPESGYVVVYPERVGSWLRDRANSYDPTGGTDEAEQKHNLGMCSDLCLYCHGYATPTGQENEG